MSRTSRPAAVQAGRSVGDQRLLRDDVGAVEIPVDALHEVGDAQLREDVVARVVVDRRIRRRSRSPRRRRRTR
ncbi:hypothetical protein RB608_10530 [Nocardioides sp. LHD-245]|uniref:hypothetical protein n=1 Tax=Nocardioides sp. LHD-245 TaxID=3051387 RepID=UPI0027DF4EC0|nr:hypothetical protein [Nocardioides sp. LHD-245]